MAVVTPDRSPKRKVTPSSWLTCELSSWENDQLKSIRFLLEKAVSNKKYFEEPKDETLSKDRPGGTDDWIKFRETMFDLYSVLDYTYFLLYCHFANGGQPDHSHDNAMKCGFPYKFKGVNTCREDQNSNQDKQDVFKKERVEFLFKGKIREGTHFCQNIIEGILAVQPKKIVKMSGGVIKKEIPEGKGESLAMLHYFRNCSTHRSLIHFEPKKVWTEFNQTTGEVDFVPEKKEVKRGEFYYPQTEPFEGYILQLPEGLAIKHNCYKLLPVILDRLVSFVQNLTSELLSAAFLLDETPTSPIKLDLSIKPFPPQVVLEKKSALMLKNEYKQQIAAKTQKKVEVCDESSIIPVEGEHQYYKGSYKLTVVSGGKELIVLSSNKHKALGKEKVKEAAIQEVIKECIRLGLIIIQ